MVDLSKEYTEEYLSMLSSFAINKSLNKDVLQMLPQEKTPLTEFSSKMDAALAEREIVGASEIKEVATALADNGKPLSKKERRAKKHAKKNMMGQLRTMQRQGQARHINALLSKRVHYTEEQQLQLRAGHNAQEDLRNIMGPRQSEAFFAAKADTLCTDFFPAPTIKANPVLMIAADGSSRTLAQVYEYFIYKHHCLLVKNADDAKEIGMSEAWDKIQPTPFVALEEAPSLDEVAQGDVV
jgi:hypothetical protein